MNTVQPQRRWFQISLRTMLVMVALASCGFGWLGYKVRQAQRQKEAVEAIRRLDAFVGYEHEFDANGNHDPKAALPGPAWLRDLVGLDFFAPVTDVRARLGSRMEKLRPHLECLSQLKNLTLEDVQLTDVESASLEHFHRLEILSLGGTQISDAGLVHLRDLTQLKDLSLGGTKITDAGLVHLQGFTQLEVLDLSGTRQTDAGLMQLQRLTKLEELYLGKVGIANGNPGRRHYSRRTPLTTEPPMVTDRGCRELEKALPNLKIGR